MTGSEPASHLYVEGYDVVVHYAMTESLYCVSQYVLKELCENAPIATAKTGKNILILGEDDIPVQEGVTGEICFPDPYFRGYINMPERTREVFRDGLFHSGDLGYRNEKGEIFIKGRIDDMIKINGNRIEPGEIEGAAREISGLKNVIANMFVISSKNVSVYEYISLHLFFASSSSSALDDMPAGLSGSKSINIFFLRIIFPSEVVGILFPLAFIILFLCFLLCRPGCNSFIVIYTLHSLAFFKKLDNSAAASLLLLK